MTINAQGVKLTSLLRERALLAHLRREVRCSFRLGGFALLGLSAAYALTLLALLLVNYGLAGRYFVRGADALRAFFFQLMAVQMALLLFLAPARIALSVVRDGAGGTLELERMSPAPGVAMAFGRVAGTLLFYGYLCLLALPFCAIVASAGAVGWLEVARSYALLFAWGYLFCLLAVCAGSLTRSSFGALFAALVTPVGVAAIGFLSALPAVAGISPLRLIADPLNLVVSPSYRVAFGRLPGLWASCCVALYCSFWALFAAARLIKRPKLAPLSRLQTLLLLAVSFALFGLVTKSEGATPFVFLCFVMIVWIVGWFLTGFERSSVRTFLAGLVDERGPLMPFYAVVALVVTVCVAVFFGFVGRVWLATAFVLVFALFYGLVVRLFCGWLGRVGKALAALVFLLQAVVPLCVELAQRGGWLQVLNPLFVLGGSLGAVSTRVDPLKLTGWALLLYGVLALLLAAVGVMSYRTRSEAYPTT